MNLRKTIKTRTFYDDQDYRDPHQDEVYRAPPTPAKQPIYQGQVVKFNSRLRPAAFPTIPLGQVVAQTGKEVTTHTGSESQAISFTRPEVTARANVSSGAFKSPISQSQDASQIDNAFQGQPGDSEFGFNVSDMFTSLDQKEWSRRLSPARSPSPERQISACDMENPVYTKNMELMERLSKWTDEDWIEAEMATSDEEDEDEEPRGRQMNDHSAPAWENLPFNVQLDLVDKLADKHATLDATFKALRLKPQQKFSMLYHIQARNHCLDEEETIITEVREETNRRLLTSNKRDLDHFQKSGHRRLLRKYLYNAVGGTDYQTASVSDLALAKSYLTMCGITLSLDHWISAENRHDTKATGNAISARSQETSKPLTSNSRTERGTVGCPRSSTSVLPRATAFPTYPVQKAAMPAPSMTSDPRIVSQPVSEVPKPMGLLRAPARRRSTYKQVKPNPPSSHKNAEPETRSESNPVLEPSDGPRIVEAPPKDQLCQQPAREPYVPPLQAIPFSLPPQLSNHQQEWLPDGRPPNPLKGDPTSQAAATVPNMINHTTNSHGVPQIAKGPKDAIPGRVHIPLPPSSLQLSQNPYRSNDAAPAHYDYNGNLTGTTPTAAEESRALVDAYEQLRQQSSCRDPPPPSSLEGPRLNNEVSSMLPPPLNSKIGLPSQLYSHMSSPLQNPYAMTYHTVDYGTATNISVTAGKPLQSTAARPGAATSTHSEDQTRQQRQSFAEAADSGLPTPNGTPNGGGVKAIQKQPPTEEDKDDDYVPAKKGRVRKTPAKASKRRKTEANQ